MTPGHPGSGLCWHLATQVAGCVMAPGHPGCGLCYGTWPPR